jgi:hypothetical protein
MESQTLSNALPDWTSSPRHLEASAEAPVSTMRCKGALPSLIWEGARANALRRRFRHKQWFYVLIAQGEKAFAVGVVDTGYAGSVFVSLVSPSLHSHPSLPSQHSSLATQAAGWLLPPGRVSFGAGLTGEGCSVSVQPSAWRFPWDRQNGCGAQNLALAIRREPGTTSYRLTGTLPLAGTLLQLDGVWEAASVQGLAAEVLSVITELPGGGPHATEKRVLQPARMALRDTAGKELFGLGAGHGSGNVASDVAGNAAGYAATDFSAGFVPRHTQWRWVMVQGQLEDGRSFAINATVGFVGASECVLWLADLSTDRRATAEGTALRMRTLRLSSECSLLPAQSDAASVAGIALRGNAEGCEVLLKETVLVTHRDARRVGPLRTSFVQPLGTWSGTIAGVRVRWAMGASEVQDTIW